MGQLIWAGFLTLKKQCELVRAQALAPDECRKSCGLALCPRAALGPNCGDYTEVGDSCGACEDPIGPKTARRLRIYGFTDLPPSLPLLPGTLFTRILESSYRRDPPYQRGDIKLSLATGFGEKAQCEGGWWEVSGANREEGHEKQTLH